MITIGADIHLHCEYRRDGVWYNCDNFEWDPKTEEYVFASIYSDRNYDLFGVLAGVRSATCEQIDEPRGLPKDMAAKTREMAEVDKEWTHSHSYLTMRELLRWREKQQFKWKKYKKQKGNKIVHTDYDGDLIYNSEGVPLMLKYEKHVCDRLIRKMEDKMNDHIFCFEEDDYYLKGDDFRIVFWFDS